jgi:hypothetical protein
MKNKGFNPLFISALDILTGALGAFIILNFLNSMQPKAIPQPIAKVEKKADDKLTKKEQMKPPTDYTGWWRKPPPAQQGKYNTQGTSTSAPSPAEKPQPEQRPAQPPSPPQDPVTVDLMRQTQGVVVILLQQADVAKSTVEMMIRQGSRTWKPARASKYQDNTFSYQKGLNYYYQTELQSGTYEVLVKSKKGSKAVGQQPFNLYGKLVPSGGKSISYAFGSYGLNAPSKEWVSAGTFTVTGQQLSFHGRLPKADPSATNPSNQTPTNPPPVVQAPSKRKGKWD